MNPAGSVTYNVSINTSGLSGQISNVNNQLGGAGQSGSTAFAAKFGAIAGLTQTVFTKALGYISGAVDNAVSRVDTLSNANRVFANMGFSAQDTKGMMDNLVKSIQGLPTSLDTAVQGVELLSGSTGNLGTSQKIFQALNDGILGFGGSAADVQGAVVQLSQAFSNGKVDAQTWNSLIQNGMGPALNALAKTMGITTGALKEGLSNGSISVQQFQDGLVNLDKNGGGGMKSLQTIVKDSTSGMGTSMDNMQTAIARGIASIIQAVGQQNISNLIKDIGSAMEKTFKVIAGAITFITEHKDIFAPIAVGIGAIVAAMALWNLAVTIATTVQTIYNAVLAANPIGIIILAIIGVTAALIYFFTKTEAGKEIFQKFGDFVKGVWDFILGAISAVWHWVQDNWPLLLAILLGPIGIAADLIIKHWDTIKNAFAAAWNFIKDVWSAVVGFFSGVWNGIVAVFSGVINFYRNIFTGAWNAITGIFSGVGNFFAGVVNTIVGAFSGIGNRISGFFSGLWDGIVNGLKSLMNSALHLPLTIPKIDILGHSVGGQTIIPRLATGGVITSPTTALIGEAGREAVLPLDRNTGWMDELAAKIGGGNATIVVKIGEETIATKVVSLINDRSLLQGYNAIKV